MDNQNYPTNQQQGNPYGQQTQYGQPNQYNQQTQYGQPGQSSGLSIASLVLGIISLFTCCLGVVGAVFASLAILLGLGSFIAKQSGKGMAIAGIICGIIALIPAIKIIVTAKKISEIISFLG